MHALVRLRERLDAFVWEIPPAERRPRWKGVLADQLRLAICVGRDLLAGELSLRAMGLVFTSLLSLVPLIAVSFSVLKGLGVHNRIEPLLERALAPLGERSVEVTDRIIGFVDNIQVGVLGTVGSAFLVFVAVSLVQKVEEAFNFTWDIDRSRTLVRRFSDYVTIIVIGPVVVLAATGITASLIGTAFVQTALEVEPVGTLLRLLGGLARFAFVIVVFTLLYLIIPNTRVRPGPALFGGVVAGVAWETVGRLFATFVVTSTSYAAIYSGFAIMLLFMVWLNLSWVILLIGSTIAFYRQHPAYRATGGRAGAQLAPADRERVAIAVMLAIAEDWLAGRPPPGCEQLAGRIGVPSHPVDRVLTSLLDAGLVVPGGRNGSGFLPGRPPGRTSVKCVLDAVRRGPPGRSAPAAGSPEMRVMGEVDAAIEHATGSLMLSELVTRWTDEGT